MLSLPPHCFPLGQDRWPWPWRRKPLCQDTPRTLGCCLGSRHLCPSALQPGPQPQRWSLRRTATAGHRRDSLVLHAVRLPFRLLGERCRSCTLQRIVRRKNCTATAGTAALGARTNSAAIGTAQTASSANLAASSSQSGLGLFKDPRFQHFAAGPRCSERNDGTSLQPARAPRQLRHAPTLPQRPQPAAFCSRRARAKASEASAGKRQPPARSKRRRFGIERAAAASLGLEGLCVVTRTCESSEGTDVRCFLERPGTWSPCWRGAFLLEPEQSGMTQVSRQAPGSRSRLTNFGWRSQLLASCFALSCSTRGVQRQPRALGSVPAS